MSEIYEENVRVTKNREFSKILPLLSSTEKLILGQ